MNHHIYDGPPISKELFPSDYVSFSLVKSEDRTVCMESIQTASVDSVWGLEDDEESPYLLQILKIDGKKSKVVDYMIVLDKQNRASKFNYGPVLLDSWIGDYSSSPISDPLGTARGKRILYGFLLFEKPHATLTDYLLDNVDYLSEAVVATAPALRQLFHNVTLHAGCCIGGRLTPSHIGLYFSDDGEIRAVIVDWSSCLNCVIDEGTLLKAFLINYKEYLADIGASSLEGSESESKGRGEEDDDKDIINPRV